VKHIRANGVRSWGSNESLSVRGVSDFGMYEGRATQQHSTYADGVMSEACHRLFLLKDTRVASGYHASLLLPRDLRILVPLTKTWLTRVEFQA
jgi:hypothetical protein